MALEGWRPIREAVIIVLFGLLIGSRSGSTIFERVFRFNNSQREAAPMAMGN